ncbi:MAG: peptidoglycan editing factor PgeF [Oscillospiraceae bacterium]|nr:peptidoglycan editing factor PgeF [Oscillospiraceae bacterium]
MSFHIHEKNGLTYLTCDLLSGVRHGFSTRRGGVSPPPWDSLNLGVGRGDAMENVRENYRRFCDAIGADAARCVLSKQVHEANVRLVTSDDCGKGLWRDRDYTSADAMICNQPDIPLVVFSADCNVILLYDDATGAVGAAHAGWRGTAQGIVKAAVESMAAQFGTHPSRIRAAIGPAIGPCCFETDNDVPDALRDALGEAAEPYMAWNGKKWHIDLRAVNALWLRRSGVERIDICDHCTACRTDLYWSHRKTGGARGAQIAMISL